MRARLISRPYSILLFFFSLRHFPMLTYWTKLYFLEVRRRTRFMYIMDQKVTAYRLAVAFFCSSCFQLRSTTTNTLLYLFCYSSFLSGKLVELMIWICTHLVVQDVRALRQWSSLYKGWNTTICIYCHDSVIFTTFFINKKRWA